MASKMFYVAMSVMRPGCGGACCVADDPRVVKDFMREYADRDVVYVNGDEMKALMMRDASVSSPLNIDPSDDKREG